MGFLENLESIFIDDFKAGVEQTTGLPVVYIDPDQLHREHFEETGTLHADDLDILQDMINAQAPGMGERFNEFHAVEVLETGPFAIRLSHEDETYCLVNIPHDDLDHKNEIIPTLAQTDISRIKEIPGWDDHWDRVFGIHEATHCSAENPDTSTLGILKTEITSDQAAIDWLKENDLDDIAEALKDYRALGTSSGVVNDQLVDGNFKHASSIFLDLGDGNNLSPDVLEAELELQTYAKTFEDELVKEVASVKGIEYGDALKMRYVDTADFMAAAQEAIDGGLLARDDPYTEQLSQDYVDNFNQTGLVEVPQAPLMTALAGFEAEMMQEVQAIHGISEAEAQEMRENEPKEFVETLESALEQGQFERPDPYTEALINNYTEGFRRQVVETKPRDRASLENTTDNDVQKASNTAVPLPSTHAALDIRTIEGGTPEINFDDDLNASTTIGGVEAPAFFASFADPELAAQRETLEQNTAPQTIPDFSFAQTEPVTPATTPT